MTLVFGLVAFIIRAAEMTSLEIKPRIIFRGSRVRFCNVFFERNSFVQGYIHLLSLVSELREMFSAEKELWNLFPEFSPWHDLFLVSGNKLSKFGAGRFVCSRTISDRTLKHTISTSYKKLCKRALALKGWPSAPDKRLSFVQLIEIKLSVC